MVFETEISRRVFRSVRISRKQTRGGILKVETNHILVACWCLTTAITTSCYSLCIIIKDKNNSAARISCPRWQKNTHVYSEQRNISQSFQQMKRHTCVYLGCKRTNIGLTAKQLIKQAQRENSIFDGSINRKLTLISSSFFSS